MKPIRVLIIVAALFLILVLVQGVQTAELYVNVTQWGFCCSGIFLFSLLMIALVVPASMFTRLTGELS